MGALVRRLPPRAGKAVLDAFVVATNALLRLPGHRWRLALLRRLCRWSVGSGTVIERGLSVTTRGGVAIGTRCVINRGVTLDGRGGLTIGDLVNISPEALILTADHDPDSPSFSWRARPVVIGSRSWIATRAVVSAGAVTSGDVAPFTIVAGVPARTVRARSLDAQQNLPPYRRWLH